MDYRLSKTEQEIMEFLWTNNRSVKTDELMEYFITKGKEWKRQTLNTLLLRLNEKGIIDRTHRGYVVVRYSKEELLNMECRDFVANVCGGSLLKFLEAYFAGEKISQEKAEELITVIKAKS